MGKSPISQLFCFHDTKHYWFYFFREYLELISYCGIVETAHRPPGSPGCGGRVAASRRPGPRARGEPRPRRLTASLTQGRWQPSKPSPEDPSVLVRGRYLTRYHVDPWVLLPTRSTNRPANGNMYFQRFNTPCLLEQLG